MHEGHGYRPFAVAAAALHVADFLFPDCVYFDCALVGRCGRMAAGLDDDGADTAAPVLRPAAGPDAVDFARRPVAKWTAIGPAAVCTPRGFRATTSRPSRWLEPSSAPRLLEPHPD